MTTPSKTPDIAARIYEVGQQLGWEQVDLANVNSLVREAVSAEKLECAELERMHKQMCDIAVERFYDKQKLRIDLDEALGVVGRLADRLSVTDSALQTHESHTSKVFERNTEELTTARELLARHGKGKV